MKIKAIVTDIEGTTSSLSFVKDVLFPYARQHISEFVRSKADDPQIASVFNDVQAEVGRTLTLDEIITQLIQWIDQDKKVTSLKTLQGLMWERGYKKGDFTGHIYHDAKQQLAQWFQQGIKLYVYSSGSVYAQKLLFGHTEYGDLNDMFSGYFDTLIGAKSDIESYGRIAVSLNLNPSEILFLSDIEQELDAVCEAGMHTRWLVRDGPIQSHSKHPQVNSFDLIVIGYTG